MKRHNGKPTAPELSLPKSDWSRPDRNASETLELLTQHLPVAVTRCSRDLRYVWANQAYADLLQRPLDQIVGRHISEVLGRELFGSLLGYFERLLAGESVDVDEQTTLPGIGSRWISVRATPTLDADGTINGWMAVIVDITERKQAEEALRQSEERFRLAARAGKMFAYEWDAATDTLVRSGDCFPILGVPEASNFTGQEAIARIHCDDRERVLATMAKLSPEMPRLQISYRIVRPDGIIVWVERNSQAYFDEHGKLLRVTGMVKDITQRAQAEEHLRESEERFRLAAQAGKMYAYEWDVARDLLVRSVGYVKILGPIDPERFTRREFQNRILADDLPQFLSAVSKLAPENPICDVTFRFLRLDDAVIWLKNSCRAFFDGEGNIQRIVGMVTDVTDQKLAEEALSSVSGRLIQAQEQERVRIARELHDDVVQRLALLSIGLGQAQQEISKFPDKARNLLGELQSQMMEITSDVQAVSRELHSSTLEHLGLVQAARSWCAQFAGRQRVEIDFSSRVSSSPPYEISLCLFRVLQEAVHNACKHSQATRVEARLWHEGGELHLTVSDTGKGFDVSAVSHERGLGLTSMRERVRLVNGTIEIDSKPMSGTTLHIRVPVSSEQVFHREAG